MPRGAHSPHTYEIVRWPTAPVVEEWEQPDDYRLGAALAGVNILGFAIGDVLGLTDLTGLCLAVSLFLLMASYLIWERKQRRTAAALAIGTLPFWAMLMMVL
jgi:hypothetical protein